MEELMDGEITRLSPTFPDSGMPTISVDGHTRLHWLQGDKKTQTFQHMTDKQIVEKIAQDAGLQAEVDDTGGSFDYVIQPNLTDLQFIRDRAKLIRFEVLVKGKKLIFRKAKESANKVYTLVWGHTQAAYSAPNTLPLRSFNPVLNTLEQKNQVTVRGYDHKNKQAFVGRAKSGDEDTTMDGKQTGPQVSSAAFHRQREHVRVNIPVASQAEADAHAKALYNEFGMSLVSATGVTIGIPDLKSGSKVELRGLGKMFSGPYYIQQATHTIGASGYQTNFTAHRNSVS
jgi:phage protein D